MPGAYHRLRFAAEDGGARGDRHDPARAAAGVRGAGRPSRRRALPRPVGQPRDHAAVRRPRAGAGASARRSREGQRHRDDLHLRRPHRRHLVARAEAAGAGGDPGQRHARPVTWGSPGLGVGGPGARRRRPTTSSPACRPKKAQAKVAELLAASGDLLGAPRPITHHVKFYEKGDRPLEIVTSRQWFIKTIEHRDGLLARGRELQWHPEYMRARFENWVNGLNGDWCISRQRFFGVPFPVWYPRPRRTAASTIRPAWCPTSRGCRSIRPPTSPTGSPRPIAAGPAASSATRTSWTPGRPRRCQPQLVTGWERDPRSVRPHLPDGSAAAGPRHHPHLAVLVGAARPPRERFAAVAPRGDLGLGARPRPQEDVEVEGQRRHPAGAAAGVRLRRRALLGGARRPRRGHRLRRRPDEDRPAPGHQAAERVEVRPGPRCGDRCDHRTRSMVRC